MKGNNPIYIMEQELEKHWPSVTKGWPNYVVNKMLDALETAGFEITKKSEVLGPCPSYPNYIAT